VAYLAWGLSVLAVDALADTPSWLNLALLTLGLVVLQTHADRRWQPGNRRRTALEIGALIAAGALIGLTADLF
jgi:hypothetical protein